MVKQSNIIITHQLKPIENPNVVNTESVPKEHPKTCNKLCKAIRQCKKVSQVIAAGKSSNRLHRAWKPFEKKKKKKKNSEMISSL